MTGEPTHGPGPEVAHAGPTAACRCEGGRQLLARVGVAGSGAPVVARCWAEGGAAVLRLLGPGGGWWCEVTLTRQALADLYALCLGVPAGEG